MAICRGWCKKHYQRWARYGDPISMKIRERGEGRLTAKGYLEVMVDGVRLKEHVRVAERVLGRTLPTNAVVHHVDGDKLNNVPNNLVICPNDQYHRLIHVRQRAYEACGDAGKRKCKICKQYDEPKNLKYMAHPKCESDRHKARRAA